MLEHRDDPEFFQEPHFTPARAAKVRVPLLHVGAWYDPFVMSSIGQYEMVSALGSRRGDPERPAAHRGAMAPWRGFGNEGVGETQFPGAAIDYDALVAGWTDHWGQGTRRPRPQSGTASFST